MIWPIFFCTAIWLGAGYVSAGWHYFLFPSDFGGSWFTLIGGPTGGLVYLACGDRKDICWNWITKPDLSPQPASPQNGPLDLATLRAAAAALKLAAPTVASTGWTSYKVVSTATAATPKTLPTSASTEPLVGYRVWHLNRDTCELVSCVHQFTWPKRKRLSRDVFQNRGIHATKSASWLAQEYLTSPSVQDPAGIMGNHQSLWNEYTADVAGEVWLWGEVTEHQLGYVAEFGYPKTLWMPEDTDPMIAMKLEENYGVSVELRSEFKKHQRPAQSDYPTFFFSPGQLIQAFHPIQTMCNYCGAICDPTLFIGCPGCGAKLNPVQNAAQGMMGTTGAQPTPAFGPIAPCYRCGGPYDYAMARCPSCDSAPAPSAIVPYTPPKP